MPQILRVCILWALTFGSCFADATTLEIAAEDAATPWSNKDGSGCANAIVKAAFAAVNIDAQLRVVPYVRCKDMVMSGAIAACLSMSWAPQFSGRVQFADEPIYVVRATYYRKKSAFSDVTDETKIPAGAVVGIVNGYEYPPAVTALQQRGVRLEAANSERINLEKLALGRIDFALFMLDRLKTEAVLIGTSGIDNVTAAFANGGGGSYIGFSRGHPDGNRAREKYNEGFKIISNNGVLSATSARCKVSGE